jgi:hypothetical protein
VYVSGKYCIPKYNVSAFKRAITEKETLVPKPLKSAEIGFMITIAAATRKIIAEVMLSINPIDSEYV